MKKINAIIFILSAFSILSCKHNVPDKKNSYVHSVIDSLKIDKTKNILIYTLNPNDCMNCLIGFVSLNNSLSAVRNPKIYVLSVEREIEKSQLLKTIKNIDLKDSVNQVVLWDKNLFMGINESVSVKKEISLSSLTIYNYQKDSIIYHKPVREIVGVDELVAHLEK